MAIIHFNCFDCGKPLQVSDDLAGKKIKCRHCDETQDVPRPKGATKEPWFYGYLESAARFLVWAAAVPLILTLVAGIIFGCIFFFSKLPGEQLPDPRLLFPSLLASLFILIWTVFILCFALIFIDIGRSLRRIQHNTEPKQAQSIPDSD